MVNQVLNVSVINSGLSSNRQRGHTETVLWVKVSSEDHKSQGSSLGEKMDE